MIVGANAEDTGGTNAGAAYIYPFEPLLDFDNFNKLAIHGGITPTSTELTDPSGASRSIGTATDIYITDTGEYDAAIKTSDMFALANTVVGEVISIDVYDYSNSQTTEQKIVTTDAASDDEFGASISFDGDYMIVGAPGNDDVGTNSGSAYIFKRSGDAWSEQAKLTAGGDAASGDSFGSSVSISGDYAIVGASRNDDGGTDSGSAYIFTRNVTTGVWSEQQKLIASDRQAGDRFGQSAISGDYAIVGAWQKSGGGAAYIFKRNVDTWSQQKIVGLNTVTSYRFGWSVAISGDTAIVGARYGDSSGTNDTGSAYIFVRDTELDTWSEQANLVTTDAASGDEFGASVAISGDYAIVAATMEDPGGTTNAGSVYIFFRTGTTWSEQAKLTAGDKAGTDYFGQSVSISGDYAIVGAYNKIGGGASYIFRRIGTSWSQIDKLVAGDTPTTGDQFGVSVAISGDYAIVGASNKTGGGAAYIYNAELPPL